MFQESNRARQSGAASCPDNSGTLPSCAGLAVPYVPFQQDKPQKYAQSEALSNGTLFPGLNLPFRLKMEGSSLPTTPLAELQALEFVVLELAIYLDTHQDDTEAFQLFQQYSAMEKSARAAYEEGEAWLDALLEHIRGNYEYAKEFLAEKFPSVEVSPLEGTYLLWANFSCLGLEARELETFMKEEALLFADEGYIFGSEGAGWERLVLACPRRHLQAALERLDAAAAKRDLPR